jgi:hypothetical protein
MRTEPRHGLPNASDRIDANDALRFTTDRGPTGIGQ